MDIRIGILSKLITPNHGSCSHCNTTWAFVTPHEVPYNRSGGSFFIVCEKCNKEATIEQLLAYLNEARLKHWPDLTNEDFLTLRVALVANYKGLS
tara:strand:+ start:258 stop:542 length:285 start_codon:yes stop_codon:yes gene_type:complete